MKNRLYYGPRKGLSLKKAKGTDVEDPHVRHLFKHHRVTIYAPLKKDKCLMALAYYTTSKTPSIVEISKIFSTSVKNVKRWIEDFEKGKEMNIEAISKMKGVSGLCQAYGCIFKNVGM